MRWSPQENLETEADLEDRDELRYTADEQMELLEIV